MEKLQNTYELEKQRLQLEQDFIQADQNYRQAQFDCRESQAKLLDYEGFSLKKLKDRIIGVSEQNLEQLQREARTAEAALIQARQERERIQQKLKKNQQQRQEFPAWEAVRDWIGEDTAGLQEWRQMELQLCKLQLLPLLEQTRQGLLNAQQVFRGDTLGRVMTFDEQQEALAAADKWALQCKAILERMEKAASNSTEIPPYFRDPVAYLATATKFTRFDRYAQAIAQTEKLIRDHRE